MEVSWNRGTPKSAMGKPDVPFLNHPILGITTIYGNPNISTTQNPTVLGVMFTHQLNAIPNDSAPPISAVGSTAGGGFSPTPLKNDGII